MYILFLVHPIFGASYLWGSLPSYVVPYISVSYFCTSYFWFFLSLRFPFLTLWFLISVDPMFGVSYFCVPIFVSSYLYVTLKMGKRRVQLSGDHPKLKVPAQAQCRTVFTPEGGFHFKGSLWVQDLQHIYALKFKKHNIATSSKWFWTKNSELQ